LLSVYRVPDLWEGSTTVAHTVVLAKFSGLMYGGNYSPVIGRENICLVCARYEIPGYGLFRANRSAVFFLVHQTREIRQTTVCAILVNPSQIKGQGVKGYTCRIWDWWFRV